MASDSFSDGPIPQGQVVGLQVCAETCPELSHGGETPLLAGQTLPIIADQGRSEKCSARSGSPHRRTQNSPSRSSEWNRGTRM